MASVHSWTEDNTPLKKSQLYRFNGKTGNVIWKWTREGTVPKVMRWFDVSADGKTLALLTDSGHNLQGSATDENDAGNGKLSVLNAEDGTEKWHMDIQPLREYFPQVTFWRGVSMSPDGKFINVTTDDGRAFIFDVNQAEPDMAGKPGDSAGGKWHPYHRNYWHDRRDGYRSTLRYRGHVHPVSSPEGCTKAISRTSQRDDAVRLFVAWRKNLAVET